MDNQYDEKPPESFRYTATTCATCTFWEKIMRTEVPHYLDNKRATYAEWQEAMIERQVCTRHNFTIVTGGGYIGSRCDDYDMALKDDIDD